METTYTFRFDTGRVESFNLELDDDSFALQPHSIATTSEPWMELERNQCTACTLTRYHYPLCPVAANLGGIVSPFSNDTSSTIVTTQVDFRGRLIEKRCKLRNGLSSMVGLVMATSGCPILDKLRPMAYTHQPFSSIDETIYRAVSGYLLAQYLRNKEELETPCEIKGLTEIYAAITHLNQSFAQI